MSRYYTRSHEWVSIEESAVRAGVTATVGISDHAQAQLGDVVFVSLPEAGRAITQGHSVATIESVKTASDVYAPLTGTILESNSVLADKPEILNADPLGAGWLFRLTLDDPDQLKSLLDELNYEATLDEHH